MEVTWWWTGSAGSVIGPLRVVLCLESGSLLWLLQYIRVKERGLNVRTIDVLDS